MTWIERRCSTNSHESGYGYKRLFRPSFNYDRFGPQSRHWATSSTTWQQRTQPERDGGLPIARQHIISPTPQHLARRVEQPQRVQRAGGRYVVGPDHRLNNVGRQLYQPDASALALATPITALASGRGHY
jgi:hypothetical protein